MAKQTEQQKGLRHLSRSELIEIIYRQQLLVEDLQQRLSDSKEKVGQLSEQIRNFEANRSLSARTEQLGADIQNMSRQLDHLNEIIRRNYNPASSPVSTENKAFMPPVPPPPAPPMARPASGSAPVPRRANRIVPPVPVSKDTPENPELSPAEEPAAPTIAQQLKGQPFR